MKLTSLNEINSVIDKFKFIMIDKKVYDLYFSDLKNKCIFFIERPEEYKSLAYFEEATVFFLEQGIKRNDELVVIGGGASSDLGGFVASSILRGINWSVISTSLLGMIDASIGGKVGVNTQYGKNTIGSFHLPKNNYGSIEFLKTLSEDDYQSGLGELVKYCFLDKDIMAMCLEAKDLSFIIKACASYKDRIVQEDFLEKGKREVLNLGHTFGHALETLSKLPHGVCVLKGIDFYVNLFQKEDEKVLENIKHKLKIKEFSFPKIELNSFLEILKYDKKNTNDDIVFTFGHRRRRLSPSELKKKILSCSYTKAYFDV